MLRTRSINNNVKSSAKKSNNILSDVESKEALRKELENVNTLYVVGLAKDKDGVWSKFRVYYIKDNAFNEVYITGNDAPLHWKAPHKTKNGSWTGGYFESRTIGTDRIFEIVSELGTWLYNNPRKFNYVFLSHE
ncbi:MAG: hypothetical protein JHC26_04900 [Thermofilum sp.]|jgi:hypothetical protein|uniref:hypothetical protein n=1 Tax=Thermofilum sp. TaxID=1961369 RepID=UPI002588D116|nr:hypothetical protein [Thermofilum sp.]MCI4408407.1 hypothetical protein [Thermofilum sp.]